MAAVVGGEETRRPLPSLGALVLGLVALAVVAPTMYRLGTQVWSKEFGAHGPIVLATGAWLL